MTPLVAQSHHQRQPQVNEVRHSPIYIGSSSPPSTPEEDRDISTPAPIPASVEVPLRRKPGRPRKVQGDDDKPNIILFVRTAGPTSDRYLPITHLARSQQALLTDSLRNEYAYTVTWWSYMKTSEREYSARVNKRLNKWTKNNRSQPTDINLFAETACGYCCATGRLCARMVVHDGQYKLALFPPPSQDGITVDDAGFWLP